MCIKNQIKVCIFKNESILNLIYATEKKPIACTRGETLYSNICFI